MAFQNFTIRNKSPVSVLVTEIKFYTPSGIRHVVDLGNFNGSTIFTGNTFSASFPMAAGESKIISIDYEYVSGANGARSGSVEIKTNANTSAIIKTTIIVDTDIILVPTPVPTPIPVPLPVPVPVPTPIPVPLPIPLPVPVNTSPPPSLPPSTYCPITFAGSPTTLIRYVHPTQTQPATGDLVLSWIPTDPAITTGLHKVVFDYGKGTYGGGDSITRYTLDAGGVKVTPAAENSNKATYKHEQWSKFFTELGDYVIFMKLVQFKIIKADGAEDLTNRVLCEKHIQINVANPTGATGETGTWTLTTNKSEYLWGEQIEFVFRYSKTTYPTELNDNWFWIEFYSTNPPFVKASQDFARGTQVRLENGKPILMTRTTVQRDQVNESATYDNVEVEATVWTEKTDKLNVFDWAGIVYFTKFKLVKTRVTASLPPPPPPPRSAEETTIYETYNQVLGRNPANWEVQEWLNNKAGRSYNDIYNALIMTQEYKDRVNKFFGTPTSPPPSPPPGPPPSPPPPAIVAKSLLITPTTILAGDSYTIIVTGPANSKVKWSLVAQPNPPSYHDEITLGNTGGFTILTFTENNATEGMWDLYAKFEDGSVLKQTLTVQAGASSSG